MDSAIDTSKYIVVWYLKKIIKYFLPDFLRIWIMIMWSFEADNLFCQCAGFRYEKKIYVWKSQILWQKNSFIDYECKFYL
jgi:hypothetical protein